MASPSTRYRISVTPIEKDGLQCTGRCTIELEHRASRDLMRLLEAAPRTAGVSGDERATLVIATQLLRDIVQRHAETEGHALPPSPRRCCRRWMHWNSCPPPADRRTADTLPPSVRLGRRLACAGS